MRLLFIGDIMGRAGREALEEFLPKVKNALEPDFIVVNGENAAHGRGITKKMCADFYALGVDCITTGNHVWDQRELIGYIGSDPKLLRPITFPPGTPGLGMNTYTGSTGQRVTVINAMCRLFMDAMEDPFRCVEEVLARHKLGRDTDAIFVDLHGEATSEKMSFGHYFDGRISAVIGTHTHMPTADHHVMKGGTAYMSDAGMSGDYDSVIGVRKDLAINRFTKKMPTESLIPACEHKMLCGALVVIDDNTGLARSIQPVRVGDVLSETMPVL